MISRAELARLIRAARAAAPAEACGVLGARRAGRALRLYVVPLAAARSSPSAFLVTRAELAAARRTLRRRRLALCGCFHSHPAQGPEPSALDRISIDRTGLWWLIYSLRDRSVRLVRTHGGGLESGRLRVG